MLPLIDVSPVSEEYLEQIYRLEQQHGVARTTRIAEAMGVTMGTVTNTIDSLKKKRLILHEPYKGIKLTEHGRRIAVNVLRRHRLAERLLTDLLDMDWSRVHEHACRLEHVLTDDLIKPLEKALSHPNSCPHGNPIPTQCGGIVENPSTPLSTMDVGSRGVIVKIVEEQQDLLEYLAKLNFTPGARITVVEKAPFDGPITVTSNGQLHHVSRTIANIVWIQPEQVE